VSTTSALASTASDRLNPIAVKEFRQAVQSRWVIAILMIFLLLNLVIVGGYVMTSPEAATSATGGRTVFGFLLAILLLTCIGFVPIYTGVRLSMERNDANLDLIFVTTITPSAIIRGKFLTAMALTLLIFSVCMPFMILTYLLRGIDLPSIFFVLATGFLVCAVANAMGIFAGSISGSWLIRGLVDVGVLICLIYMAFGTIAMAEGMLMFGGGMMGGTSWWGYFGWWGLIEVAAVGALYVLSVALLSPKPSNRMFVPRLYVTGSWAVLGAVMAVWGYCTGSIDPVKGWMIGSCVVLTAMLLTSLGERDVWSARVRRTIPRNRLWRAMAFVFYTGSAGGLLWCTLLFLATLAGGAAWTTAMAKATPDFWISMHHMAMVFAYVLCYCLTTAVLRMLVFKNVPTPSLSVIAAFLGIVAWLVPYVVVFLASNNPLAEPAWSLQGSPMILSTNNQAAKEAAQVLVFVWLAVALIASSPWGGGQWQRFTPYRAMALTTVDAAAGNSLSSPDGTS
jgi:hypothetical protein